MFLKPGVHAVKPRPNLFPRASCYPYGGEKPFKWSRGLKNPETSLNKELSAYTP